MNSNDFDRFDLETDGLKMHASIVSYDQEIFGFNVASVQTLEIYKSYEAFQDFDKFEEWANDRSVNLVSCRLPHDQLISSMFLESKGFRFIEMVLHPTFVKLQSLHLHKSELTVNPVDEGEVEMISLMAERSFSFERYHIDPRIDCNLADKRYGRWVYNSFNDPKQILLKITHLNDLLGFFIIENKSEEMVYWHLTAINPDFKGKKMGAEIWKAMMLYHRNEGKQSILTTISARNTPVLNLYSKLNFRFCPPEMTLHWFREPENVI